MGLAKVVRTRGGLTVSLPDDAVLPEGDVEVRQDGENIVLMPKPYGLRLLDVMEQLGELIEQPADLPWETREGL